MKGLEDTIQSKISASYFVNTNKMILKFIQKEKRPRIATARLKKKIEVGRLTVPHIEMFCEAT